jgi:ATP-dependent helicase/nuclease subunit B
MHSLLAIYPTSYKVEDLLKRQSLASGCLLGYRVTTFPQITDALWREAGVTRVMFGPIGERLALEEAIRRVSIHGFNLPFVLGQGVGDHLLRFIHDVKSAGIDGADLRQACAALPDQAAPGLQAMAETFAEYDQVLRDRGAADRHDRERLVVEWLHRLEQAGQRSRFLDGIERLLVAEIYDPSLLQFMLVASLIRLIGNATLTIQAEPFDLRIRGFAELTWNRFVGEGSIADQVLPAFVRRDGREGRLGFVLTHLFLPAAASPPPKAASALESLTGWQELASGKGEVPPQDGTVRIVEASNPQREAKEVAREIRRMLELPASEQVAFDRIGIVVRELAAYDNYLDAAFDAYRIPLNLLRRQPLSAFAPARLVRDILRIPLQDYPRDSLLSLCGAPFLSFTAARYPELPTQAGYIDRQTRPLTSCIQVRRAEMVSALEAATSSPYAEKLRSQLAHFDRAAQAWGKLIELLATLEPSTTIADYVVRTRAVLDQLGFDPVRDSLTDSAAAAAGPLKSALETLANEASVIAPERRVTLTEFAALIERILDETAVERMTDHLAGGVRAMTVTDARGLDFDLVFIIGLNDGIFPAYRSEDPLVPDETIRRLNPALRDALRRRVGTLAPEAPGPILRTHLDRNAEEPFLFFLAMSMPARSVVLSYSVSDGFGNPLPVSPFVGEVRRILNGTQPERVGGDGVIPSANDCFAHGEFLTRAALDSVLPQPAATSLADAIQIASILRRTEVECRREQYLALPTREELVKQRRQQIPPNDVEWLTVDLSADGEKLASACAYNGRLTTTPAVARFLLNGPRGGPREWSAAQLTELAACGYKFFARRVLLLREAEDADYEQTPLETGTLVHKILDEIFSQAEPLNPGELRASARHLLDHFHRRGRLAARDPAFFEIDWRSVEAMVDEIIEHEIARRPQNEVVTEMHHEFPIRCVLPPATDRGGGDEIEIALIGQIDRLEIYRDAGRIRRLKLVDYKSSRRLSDYAEVLRPSYFACEDLQMPVYALGAAEHFRAELSPEATVEVSYIALKNRDKETSKVIPLELLDGSPGSSAQKTVGARSLELVGSAVRGRFDVDPLQCSDYCPYRRVCRYRKLAFDS